MIRTITHISHILQNDERRRALFLVSMCIPLAIAELAGLLGAIPFIMVAATPDAAQSNWIVARLLTVLGDVSRTSLLIWLGFASLIVMVLSVAFRTIYIYFTTLFAREVGASLQSRLLASHLRRPQVQNHKRHGAVIQATVVVEAEEVVEEVILNALRVATYLSTALIILALLVFTDPVAGVVMLTLIGAGYMTVFGLSRRILLRLGQGRVLVTSERHRLLQEAVGGQRELQLAQRENAAVKRFKMAASKLGAMRAYMTLIKEVPRGFLEILIFGSMILLSLWLLQARADQGAAILPIIAIYALAAARLFPVLQRLYKAIAAMKSAEASLSAVRRELAEDVNASVATIAEPISLTQSIELKDVHFSYPEAGRAALSGVSLKIPARTFVAFVGETGAGKSTAVDMLLGLISPDRGQVLVDQEAITPRNRRGWQTSVGYVPQDIFLSDGTIAENIAFGLQGSEIDTRTLNRVVASSGLSGLVNTLPDGVDTRVGERGVRLSGGERQRIGIARALYNSPDLIVLDEATSALDTITELSIIREVRALGAEKTIVVVAHRLSTVRHCDQIFLFGKGRLLESGSYGGLLSNNDHFRALHEATQ